MKFKLPVHWLAVVAMATWLGACGDGTTDITELVPDVPESEDPANEDPANEDPANGEPTIPIYVTFTSHEDAQVITGSRTITLAGTVTSTTEITAATLTATLNGEPMTVDVEEDTFSVELTLGDLDNVIEVLVAFQGESHNGKLTLNYPFLAFADGQDAAVVIGQPDFETSNSELSATGLSGVWGNPAVGNGILYLADTSHHRVLGYNGIPTVNGAAADFVLGQPDFTSAEVSATQGGLNNAGSISIKGDTMAVADARNHRVLLYQGLPVTTGTEPDVVIGQADFEANDPACDATSLRNPYDVRLTESRLFVADRANHRVLIWNTIPTQNGAPADVVLGQESLDSCESGTNASALNRPMGVWSDNERVVVTDVDNNRVLIWNTVPSTHGQAADIVLGQENMDASEWDPLSATSFAWPIYATFNGNQLFVGDCGANSRARVLTWDAFPEENNVPADRVLGSPDFEDPPGGTTQSSLRCIGGLIAYENQLIVSDADNARVLIFEAP